MLSRKQKSSRFLIAYILESKLVISIILILFILSLTTMCRGSTPSDKGIVHDPHYLLTIYTITFLERGKNANPKSNISEKSPRSKSKSTKPRKFGHKRNPSGLSRN